MSRMMRGLAMLVILGVSVIRSALAHDVRLQDLPFPKITTETHALDALLGRWNCLWDLHSPRYTKKVNVTWMFASVGEGFMIHDEFQADNGVGGTLFLGETYRAYNPVTKGWTYQATQYVNPKSGMKSGEWDAGVTQFENGGIIDVIQKGIAITKFMFYPVKRDSFSVVGERSKDGGKTWSTITRIECIRAQQ